jgi:ribose 5-phosphate isomerase A
MSVAPAQDPHLQMKIQAGHFAADMVQSGMVVGLGTGSTAIHAVRKIGERLKNGELTNIIGIATSVRTDAEARQLGIPLMDDSLSMEVDVTIDGADEVDPRLDLIKGGGGALLREKIVAEASAREIIVVDEGKLSDRLGMRFRLPVEVVPFGSATVTRRLEGMGAEVSRRMTEGVPFVTDQGNAVLDCAFGPIDDAPKLARELDGIAGIAGHGLFIGLAHEVIVAGPTGLYVLARTDRD